MTQVDFYILPEDGSRSHNDFIVQLSEQLYRAGHKFYIHSQHQAMSEHIDELLWTKRDISFIPHDTLEPADTEDYSGTPVTIGSADDPSKEEILLNLATTVPEFFSRYLRVVEIISGDPAQRQQGRERYKYYRDRGYQLNSHKL